MATTKTITIEVAIQRKEEVAKIVAAAELRSLFDAKNAELKMASLERDGITQASLAKYYLNLQTLVGAFAEDKRKVSGGALKKLGFRMSELRLLYLPTLTATILSQVGDVTIGNYRVEVHASAKDKVDRDFVIEMSEALYRNKHIIFCERDQIGVLNREYNPEFMANVIMNLHEETRTAEVVSKDGTNPDVRLKAMAVFAGLNLVNTALSVLYPVVDYVDYGEPGDTIAISRSDE